jgi:hypothetical protein
MNARLDTSSSIDVLRRFARPRPPVERCELCGAELAAEHRHLWETAASRMICSCDACGILFEGPAERVLKFRPIPHRIEYLPDFRLTDLEWESLSIPIDLAFFHRSTSAGRVVAMYPSPAGATESLLPLETWQALAAENPVLEKLAPDIEALLVNRARGARECYRVSLDECYRLTGLIRAHWSGLSGGMRTWQEIAAFFARLKEHTARSTHA